MPSTGWGMVLETHTCHLFVQLRRLGITRIACVFVRRTKSEWEPSGKKEKGHSRGPPPCLHRSNLQVTAEFLLFSVRVSRGPREWWQVGGLCPRGLTMGLLYYISARCTNLTTTYHCLKWRSGFEKGIFVILHKHHILTIRLNAICKMNKSRTRMVMIA